MSFYSLDSLEAFTCYSDNAGYLKPRRQKMLDAISLSSTNRGDAAAAEDHQVIERPDRSTEPRNLLIASASPRADLEVLSGCRNLGESSNSEGYSIVSASPISTNVVSLPVSIPNEISHRGNSTLKKKKKKKQSSSRSTENSTSTFKNDKKLVNVLAPVVIEAKTKPKTYLEQYRERLGVPTKKSICSPEGSTLSVYGDTSYEPITDVDSRPPTTTPRDDQSELSFYRRLINQPRTTRSCDVGHSCMANREFRSVSDYGLTLNSSGNQIAYRPYSIRDYECLTVPRADRSLGPDAVEIREKWEKLMRRTQYGDLASSRNRQNVVRRSELRKDRRTNVQKHTVEFSLTEDGVAGQVAESKDFGDTKSPDQPNSAKTSTALKKAQRTPLRSEKILTVGSVKHPKSSTRSHSTGPRSFKSLIPSLEENIGDSSLEDLQRRHQNEKRVMDLLINRTLLR